MSEPATLPGMDLPLRSYVKSFKMSVIVYSLKTDKPVLDTEMDYGNPEHRKWLGKLTYFACSNGYSVETMSLKDRENY